MKTFWFLTIFLTAGLLVSLGIVLYNYRGIERKVAWPAIRNALYFHGGLFIVGLVAIWFIQERITQALFIFTLALFGQKGVPYIEKFGRF